MIKTERLPGISFIVRCHNEQDHIAKCISSLKDLTVPHEIIVILHKCTDNSRMIALGLKQHGFPITIVEYEVDMSRTGYDTLVTPVDHPKSTVVHLNHYYSYANMKWIFRFDADMFANPGLIQYLNSLDMNEKKFQTHKICCRLGDHINKEPYLSNCLIRFNKSIFWEVGMYKAGLEWVDVEPSVYVESLPVSVVKTYWKKQRWYLEEKTYDIDLARKLLIVQSLCGTDEIGMARASGPNVWELFSNVKKHQNELALASIFLYK